MQADWLDERFEDKARRDTQTELASERATRAAVHAPVVFQSLCHRIRAYIERYQARFGESDVKLIEAGGILAVHRGTFPAFHLEIKLTAGADITIAGFKWESRTAKSEDLSGVISIEVGDQPDQCWMIYRGENYTSEDRLSEAVLAPVLDPLLR